MELPPNDLLLLHQVDQETAVLPKHLLVEAPHLVVEEVMVELESFEVVKMVLKVLDLPQVHTRKW